MWSRSDGWCVGDCCQFCCWCVVVVDGRLMGQYHNYTNDASERVRLQQEVLRMEKLIQEIEDLRNKIVELRTELERVQRELGNKNV
jgi:hypothetical protein